MKKSNIQITFAAFSLLLLASCGGGGGGGESPTMTLSADSTQVLVGSTAVLTWSSNQTTCSASGAWSGSKSGSGTETVSIGSAGSNNFNLSCGTISRSVTVTGNRLSAGIVADGYMSGATVFYDGNENGILDSGETSQTTDTNGTFSLGYENGVLISKGGTDLDTQTVLSRLVLAAPNDGYVDNPVITPITTIAALMEVPSDVNAILGIDPSINVLTTDPVANKLDGGKYDVLYEKGAQLTVLALSMTSMINYSSSEKIDTSNAFSAITDQLEVDYKDSSLKVNIESSEFIASVVDKIVLDQGINISDVDRANTILALSSTLPRIQVKSDNSITTSIINFALNTLVSDVALLSAGLAGTTANKYQSNSIDTYIASSEGLTINEVTPGLISINDIASTDEDVAVTIQILSNDELLPGDILITITSPPINGTAVVAGNAILYTPNADINGDDSFSYSISIGNLVSSADVQVSVAAINDAPSISAQTSATIVEGNTSVSDVKISDVDGDNVSITLSGTDADSFEVIDGVLTFKSAPDFFVKNAYSVTIVATDGTLETSVDLIINVRRLQVEGFDIPDAIKVIETL